MNSLISSKPLQYGLFLSLFWVFAFHQPLYEMVSVWQRSETFQHGFLIYPISAWLIWRRRFRLQEIDFKPTLIPLIPLIACCGVWLSAEVVSVQVLTQLAAVAWLPLALWCLFGHQFFMTLWFPLCYLFFAVPIGEEIIPQLQIITADISVFLLKISGIPVFRDGLYLSVPGGLFEVAVACSGIRYLIASVALGTLFAHLQFSSLKRQIAFIIISLLVPILANGIRAYLIVVLAYSSDMALATGVDHLVYGWLFFGFVMFILFWIGSFWRQPQAEPITKASRFGVWHQASKAIYLTGFIVLSMLVTQAYQYKVENREIPNVTLADRSFVPFTEQAIGNWSPTFYKADDYFTGQAFFAGQAVELYIALYQDNSQGKELINFNHKLFNGELWTPESLHIQESELGPFATYQLTTITGRKLETRHWFQLSDLRSASQGMIKLTQAWQTLSSQSSTGAVVILATEKSESSDLALHDAMANLTLLKTLWIPNSQHEQ